ncbi:hypothetical protein D3C84_1130080 [compost metagenome]
MNMILGISYSFVLPFTSLFGIAEVGMSNTEFGVFMTVSAIANVGFLPIWAKYPTAA